MTFEQCRATLDHIRRNQSTTCPVVRVDYAGKVFKGRVTRSDCDPGARKPNNPSPYGVLVLEDLGLGRGPETILQIANIPPGGIGDPDPA